MTSADPYPPQGPESGLAHIIGRLAHDIGSGAIGPGDLAELRRLHIDAPDRPAFWRMLTSYVERGEDGPPLSVDAESRWAIVLSNMARMAPRPHDPTRSLGRTLDLAGFHELRLMRLLRTDGPTFATAVRRACGFLASQNAAVDWRELAALVLTRHPERAEAIRRRIARDFYASRSAKEA